MKYRLFLLFLILLTGCTSRYKYTTVPPRLTLFPSSKSSTPTLTPTPTSTITPQIATQSTGPVVLYHSNLVIDLAVDSQAVYWSVRASGSGAYDGMVLKKDKAGGQVQVLADKQSSPSRLTGDPDSLYWIDIDYSGPKFSLMSVPKTGGSAATLWQSQDTVSSLVVDEQNIYWNACSSNPYTGSILKMAKKGGQAAALISEPGCPTSITLDNGQVYWVNKGLSVLEQPDGKPRVLFEDTRLKSMVTLRDEHSYVMVQRILQIGASDIYVSVYVDNYPGVISCTDQRTNVARLLRASGELQFLQSIPGNIIDFTAQGSSFYLIGNCSYNAVVMDVGTGAESTIELGQQPNTIVLDGGKLYWVDYEGVKVKSLEGAVK